MGAARAAPLTAPMSDPTHPRPSPRPSGRRQPDTPRPESQGPESQGPAGQEPAGQEPDGQPPGGRGSRRRARRTVVLGVLGGIAAGKSRVAAGLAGPGGLVIAADSLAHEALGSPEVRAQVAAVFGPGVLGPDGQVDRKALGAVVFADPAARRQLEGWIHPWVRARISAALEGARMEGRPRVVLDVPLLLEHDAEHGLARACDHLVFVEVDAAERDRRAVTTRGWEPGEVARREAAQLPLSEKRRRADVVVQNDGTQSELDAAIAAALAELGLG